MLPALLFDLDGTLVDSSVETFLPPYFSALSGKLAEWVSPDRLIRQLQDSTRVMMANEDAARTNAEVFAGDFFPKIGVPREKLAPVLDDFYRREYVELRAFVKPIPEARSILERAFGQHRTVVVATAPVYPLTALQQRLEWGDVGGFPYALITHYEAMHSSKPNPAYYREIAAQIGRAPEECVMIGNDVQMDILPARRVGMRTFWITDAGGMATDVPADWRGTLENLNTLLETGDL